MNAIRRLSALLLTGAMLFTVGCGAREGTTTPASSRLLLDIVPSPVFMSVGDDVIVSVVALDETGTYRNGVQNASITITGNGKARLHSDTLTAISSGDVQLTLAGQFDGRKLTGIRVIHITAVPVR